MRDFIGALIVLALVLGMVRWQTWREDRAERNRIELAQQALERLRHAERWESHQ